MENILFEKNVLFDIMSKKNAIQEFEKIYTLCHFTL